MSQSKSYSRRSLLFGGLGQAKDKLMPELQKLQGVPKPVDHALRSQADRALQNKEYAAAARLYEQILEECKEDCPATRARLGFCYYRAGFMKNAVDELERALAAKTRNNLAALYLGLAYARLDDQKNAERAWRRYFAPEQTLVQREVNIYVALMERSAPINSVVMADAVEAAIEAQKRQYTPMPKA